MHHAQRPLRTNRPGARSAASAAKLAVNIGKWALPPGASAGAPAPPTTNKWAPLPPSSTAQRPLPPQLTKPRLAKPVFEHRLSKWQVTPPAAGYSAQERQQAVPREPNTSASKFTNLSSILPQRPNYAPPSTGGVRTREAVDKQDARHDQATSSRPRDLRRERVTRDDVKSRSGRDAFKERGSLISGGSLRTPATFRYESAPREVQKRMEKEKAPRRVPKKVNRDLFIPSVVSVGNLAKLLGVRLDRLQRKMVQAGMKDETSYDYILTAEYASLIAMEFGRDPVVNDEAAFDLYSPSAIADSSSVPVRPPIVTIMGHVDHGKTTLLDTLRSASVAAGEAGGITQHIGAFSVDVPNTDSDSKDQHRRITFLDTPGHAAFSSMRSRGASVTDVVVLVVAADDGIMPQTREVLDLVRKEGDGVSLIVAINKVDKPGVDIDAVEKALLAHDVQLETFGGDIPVVHVSGLTGQGLPQLVETISLVAELRDLRAPESGPTQGYVIESRVDKGLGPVATVLNLHGSLTVGTHLICGTTSCKVRRLTTPSGESVRSVGPGMAAVVIGWREVPNAGDEVLSGTEDDVKRAVTNRLRKVSLEAALGDVDAINGNVRAEREAREAGDGAAVRPEKAEDKKKELRVLIKADVSGTVEAVSGALQGIGNHLAGVKVVSSGVGPVTESDVMRAKASEASIVAFSVTIPRSVHSEAAGQQVNIIESNIIYRLMDDVRGAVSALLPPIIETRVTGEATVLQLFDIQAKAKQIKKVAGCRVTNGIIDKTMRARVVRNGETVHEGTIETLRNQKTNVNQAAKGLECGMSFENWQDLRMGDLIQVVQDIEKPRTL